ncbi:MAG: transcriptional regulator, GntR family [Herminiimonas sp.]|nr:transcriptional regulator, GntR family [Herminiimonas sp.]
MTGAVKQPLQGLALSISEQLKQLIYSGEILPGERLNEAALALRMGTSRGPIREAIRILAGFGIVTAVPNKGVFVRKISVREMLEIYELRALVFGFAAQRATERLTAGNRLELERLLKAMDTACETGDGNGYYSLNLEFHALILTLSNNKRAHQAYLDYVNELHLFRRKYFDSPGNMRKSNVEHWQIYEAICSGSEARAKTTAERHVLSGRQRLLSTLDQSAE